MDLFDKKKKKEKKNRLYVLIFWNPNSVGFHFLADFFLRQIRVGKEGIFFIGNGALGKTNLNLP